MKNYKNFSELNESKLNGKYGFFMFLDIIDKLKNSFINENFLNVRDFNIFFTTDKIKDKNKLSDLIEYKKSLDVAFITLSHIKNLRLSFYFGVRDYNIEYGFHDDLKRMVYKIGEFKITSKYLNSLSSYKCITMISKILKNANLKDLGLLQKSKNDLKYLFDEKFNDIKIQHGNMVVKKINNIELKNYYNQDNISDYFNSWSFKHKWYYNTWNYIDTNQDDTYFYIKIKDADSELNLLKKNDIKHLKKLHEDTDIEPDDKFVDTVPGMPVNEPMVTEPLNTPVLKMMNGRKNKTGKTMKKDEKEKELIKYYKSLKKIIITVNKDMIKDKGYLTKYLYKVVGEYKKPFDLVKKDLQWLVYELRKNQYFIENEEENFKEKIEKKKEKEKRTKENKAKSEKRKKRRI